MTKADNIKAAGRYTSSFFIACILLTGCAPLQTVELITSGHIKPEQIELTHVPFIAQQAFQCGPASMAMMLQTIKKDVTVEELLPRVYLPKQEGSLQIEMLAAARQYDVIPYVLDTSMADLLAEVSAGNPVLVLQNLGMSWIPRWHYAVVIGYDFSTSEIILRSGVEERHVVAMKVFERTWARSDYWAVVMMLADTLPATAKEKQYVAAVVTIERMKKYQISIAAYQTALLQWPNNHIAMMGLGNSYYALQDYYNAAEVFRKASLYLPDSGDAFNNLADTLSKLNRMDEALLAARRAVDIGGVNAELYLKTLYEIEHIKSE